MSRHKALKGIVQESYYDEYDDDGYGDEIPKPNKGKKQTYDDYDEQYGDELPQEKKEKKKKPAKSKLFVFSNMIIKREESEMQR